MDDNQCVKRIYDVLDTMIRSEPVVPENYEVFSQCIGCSSGKSYCVTWPLHAGAMLGNLAMLKKASAKQPHKWYEKYDSKGHTVLHCAILKARTKVVNWLLKIGADPNKVDKNTDAKYVTTPLYMAVVLQDLERTKIVLDLLAAGANPNHPKARDCVYGTNCLHNAAFFGEIDIVRALLKHGMDAQAPDSVGMTAQDWAIQGSITAPSRHDHITVLPDGWLFRSNHSQILKLLSKCAK